MAARHVDLVAVISILLSPGCTASSTETARPIAAIGGDSSEKPGVAARRSGDPAETSHEEETAEGSAEPRTPVEETGSDDGAGSLAGRKTELRKQVEHLLGDDSALADEAGDAIRAAGEDAIPFLIEALAKAPPGSTARTRILDMATDIDHPSRARVLHAAARDPKDLDAPVRLVLNGRAPDIEVGLSHPGMSTIVAKLRRHADGRVTLDDMSHAIARVWKSVDEQVERLHATSRGPLKKFLASVIAAGRDKSRPLEKRPGPGGGEGWGPHPPAKGAIDEEPR